MEVDGGGLPGQDWLHNLQNPVKNENAEPVVQKLRISRGQQQSIKPSAGQLTTQVIRPRVWPGPGRHLPGSLGFSKL